MTGYSRQSSADIVPGAVVRAVPVANEFNALEAAFSGTLGHTHDGTIGNGQPISLTGSVIGTLPIANGGTGAVTAAAARTSLGLAIGTDVQAYDAGLASIAGLTTLADRMIYTTALDTYAVTTLTSFGRSLIDDADASAARTTLGLGSIATQASSSVTITGGSITGITDLAVADGGTGASTAANARINLGLVIGTNVQAYDADLTAIAALTSAFDKVPYSTGAGTWALADFSAFGRSIVDDADAATTRTTLGLGSAATMTGPSGAIVGTTDTQTLTNKTLTSPTINGGTFTGGTDIAVADGGTGASTAADARTNLGLVIGTNVQAFDAGLLSIAGLTTLADRMIYTTASDTYAVTPLSAYGRTLIDDADAATARTTLGLVIGTNVQAYDADLDSWAGKTAPSGTVVGTTDTQTLTNKTLTSPTINAGALSGTFSGAHTYTGVITSSLGTSTTSANYIRFQPTDYGVGKPYLHINKDASATSWSIGLWDSATTAGTINLIAGTGLQWNGVQLVDLSSAQTLTNKSLTSPTLTGVPTAPTAIAGTNTTQVATTAFVADAIATGGGAFQPLDDDLTAIAALTSAANKVPYSTGAGTWALSDFSAFGRTLVDDADASAARTTLGLGSLSLQASSSVTITGGSITGITDLAIADGGTGASTAADARTNLGLVIGTNVQAYDAGLLSIAGLTTLADRMIYTTASDTYAVTALSAYGRTLIDDADASTARTTLGLGTISTQASSSVTITGGSITGITDIAVADGGTGASTAAAARTNLGLVIGTDVQAHDAELTAIANLTSAADRLPYFTGSGTASLATFTAFGRSIVDDADAAAVRTTLGLGTVATMAGPVGDIVGETDTQTLTNKSFSDSTTFFIDEADNTKKVQFQVSGVTTGTTRTLTLPNQNGVVALLSDLTALSGADFSDTSLYISDNSDSTKKVQFEVSGVTTATTRTLTIPNASGTIVLDTMAQTLTNKTLTSPTINGGTFTGGTDIAVADGGTGSSTAAGARTNLGLVIGTNVQAWDADLDTWATKTAPSGTVVGTSDTQTLTNKTLTSPTINAGALSGTFSGAHTYSGNIKISTSNSTTATEYLKLEPNDYGTGKPAVTFKKETTADYWTLQFWDGTSSGGTLSFNVVNLQHNGVPIVTTSVAMTLTNKSLSDSTTFFVDNSDTTKKMQFEVSGVTTATTRTLTVPNASGTIVLDTMAQTLTNKTLTSPSISGGTFTGSTAILSAIAGLTFANGKIIVGTSSSAVAARDIVGTVSQSGGIPTGAIVEAGSNANGYYTKFADGTMICRYVDTTGLNCSSSLGSGYTSSSAGTWTYPVAFVNTNDLVLSASSTSSGRWASAYFPSSSSCSYTLHGWASSASLFTISLLAIGRWF